MALIHILSPETARLIAAGEVIDRPASALRELLDNAIDSGAKDISVRIESGGIGLISVSDDGCGMSAEDLRLSVREHATSKIECADDLLRARTLGFRGEALASIASAARLEILTCTENADSGWRLRANPGTEAVVEPAAARRGTTVTVSALFERYPARRQFLKRPQSEASLCRQVFAERAASHPSISFRWQSGEQNESYPATEPERRIAALHPEIPFGRLSRTEIAGEGFSCLVLYADPSFHRRDRRLVQVFVNRRKVPEWGLMSMLEYAYSPWLPGGMKPCVFLFAEVDPSQADFNIHPAKREVRLKYLDKIKSALFAGLRDALASSAGYGGSDFGDPPIESAAEFSGMSEVREMPSPPEFRYSASRFPEFREGNIRDPNGIRHSNEALAALADASAHPPSVRAKEGFRYLGHAFGPFLLFEMDEILYILDQHAAHERILYDGLKEKGSAEQPLLVPLVLDELGADAESGLALSSVQLREAGYRIEKQSDRWIVTGVPSILGEKAVTALAEILEGGGGIPGDRIIATIACRAAVKDGDELDPAAACDLFRRALELPVARCPHGRPIWIRMDRERLYRMVGRITG